MEDYEHIKNKPRYIDYWKAQRALCELALEKKSYFSEVDDKLFEIDEIEDESELYLQGLSNKELVLMQQQLAHNLKTNQSFASEFKFWQSLGFKIRYKMAVRQVLEIYDAYLKTNESLVDLMIAEQAQKQKEEESKSDKRPVKIILSLAEKIKKTALNTGIRFNIVDNLGFDNSSLAMFQDAQKQGLNPDE